MARLRDPHPPTDAFSLVELLMSIAISGIVIVGAARLWGESSRVFQQLRVRNGQEAVVDEDIAVMEDLAYRYTCCPGACTTNASTISGSPTCRGKEGSGIPSVGTEYYYFPYYPPSASSTPNITLLENLCSNGTLVNDLVAALRVSPVKDSRFNRSGQPLTRTIIVDNATAHRVRIDYMGTNLKRSTMLVPTAARWCP